MTLTRGDKKVLGHVPKGEIRDRRLDMNYFFSRLDKTDRLQIAQIRLQW